MSTYFTRSKVHRLFLFTLSTCLAGLVTPSGWVRAERQADAQRAAEECVNEALHREIYGQHEQRSELLKRALDHSTTCKPALWHSGYVQVNKRWHRVEDVAKLTTTDKRLIRYENKRAAAAQSVAGQMEMADWCGRNGFPDRRRAHLTRVLEIDPEYVLARRQLGFVRVDDTWLSREEVVASRQRAAAAAEAYAHWQPKLQDLRRRLVSGTVKQREYAAAEVRAIQDPASIPALEAVLSIHSAPMANLVVEALAGINGSEAALSLARHAVFSQFQDVRQSAAEKLRDCTMSDYVPALLSALRTPIRTQREVVQGPRGRLLYRHVFYREGQQDRDIAIFETQYQRVAMPDGSRRQTLKRAVDDIRDRAEQREESVETANRQRVDLNGRLMTALEVSTRVNLFNTPEQWWTWWNEYNEVYVSGDKQTRETLRQDEVTLVDESALALLALSGGPGAGGPSPSGQIGSGGTDISGMSGTMDCLAAGTPVWTDRGPRAIETIQVGDRVLAQDPETGELAYKPVLGTTVRPPSELIKVHMGDEEIQTSGGHLFWIAGDGWVKSRNVKSGTAMHAVAGAASVSMVETGSKAETYNLIVADFHTYFVGKNKVLSHDNTVRQPTAKVVPGLAAE